MNARAWNTYAIRGYTHQAGTDSRATGGVHRLEVRRLPSGAWQRRTVDSNGRFASPGPAEPIATAEGEALFATAQAR